jgi:hypothetical protein
VGIPAQEHRQEKPMNDVVAPVWNGIDFKAEAHRDPWSVPLDEIDVSNPYLYSEDTWHGFSARLRRDDPVHFCDSPLYGPYWSVTRYRDIMTVDTSHQIYSSDAAFTPAVSTHSAGGLRPDARNPAGDAARWHQGAGGRRLARDAAALMNSPTKKCRARLRRLQGRGPGQ